MFWPDAVPVPLPAVCDVTRAVSSGAVDAGVLPVENTLFGSVDAARDAIANADEIFVVGEFVMNVRQCLLGIAGANLELITTVESHPVALGQCSQFLSRMPNAREVAVYDTAAAARSVAESRDPRRAAIANARAAGVYGLVIIADHIEDTADNQTRFLSIATAPARLERGTPARTTFDFLTDNEPGALVRALNAFASNDLNLVRLDSRPAGKPWTYLFSADIDHVAGDSRLDDAVAMIRESTKKCRILGTYARART